MHPFDDDGASAADDAARPAWFDDAHAAMEAEFDAIAWDTPGWPDPHRHLREPEEAEYSRVLDPGKYRILDRRWSAWVRALEHAGVATTRYVPQAEARWADARRSPRDWLWVQRVEPVRGAGLVLVVARTVVDGAPYALDVAIASSATADAVHLASVPFCGCDACDDGSVMLLEEVDEWVLAAARGRVKVNGTLRCAGPPWAV